MKRTKPQTRQLVDENPVEAIRNVATTVGKSVTNDLAKGIGSDFFSQFLNINLGESTPTNKLSGDLAPGQELSLNDIKKAKPEQKKESQKPQIEAGIDYIGEVLHGAKRIEQEENQKISAKINETILELKKLISTSKILQTEFKEITTQKQITKVGKYYVSFFEWMLSAIKQARMRVEDSGTWLMVAKGKHAKKGAYWQNADEKVGGTSFQLSGERVVATQVG